jgi:hypothetical protein
MLLLFEDKQAKPGKLTESNALSEIWKNWREKKLSNC